MKEINEGQRKLTSQKWCTWAVLMVLGEYSLVQWGAGGELAASVFVTGLSAIGASAFGMKISNALGDHGALRSLFPKKP